MRPALRVALCAAALLPGLALPDLATADESAQVAATAPFRLIDAVRITLSQQPEIQIAEQEVVARRGVQQSATGQFDVTLQASISQRGSTVPLPDKQAAQLAAPAATTYTTSYELRATKQLRLGTVLRPSVQLSRVAQTALDPAYGQAQVVFSIVQPLLRGRGASATAAAETAAGIDVDASALVLRHRITEQVRDAAIAYWSYAAAVKAVALWRDAEARAQLLLSEQEKLIRAGERPAADLHTVAANLADIKTQRIEAERAEIEARQALAVAMGLGWSAALQLPPPAAELPDAPLSLEQATAAASSAATVHALVTGSLRQRADLRAARMMQRSARVLSTAARRNLEPQLDLQVDLGYGGLSEGNGAAPFVTPLADRVLGLNFFTGLGLQLPIQNNAARGALVQRQAQEKQAGLIIRDLERRIGADVVLALATLVNSLLAMGSSESALLSYREAVGNEKKKLRAGLATLFDVVLMESRLNGAEQTALRARARVAAALVQLRFQTGSILAPSGPLSTISSEQLTTMPPELSAEIWKAP